MQCWTNVENVGPTLYKCYSNFLCLLRQEDFLSNIVHAIRVGAEQCLKIVEHIFSTLVIFTFLRFDPHSEETNEHPNVCVSVSLNVYSFARLFIHSFIHSFLSCVFHFQMILITFYFWCVLTDRQYSVVMPVVWLAHLSWRKVVWNNRRHLTKKNIKRFFQSATLTFFGALHGSGFFQSHLMSLWHGKPALREYNYGIYTHIRLHGAKYIRVT